MKEIVQLREKIEELTQQNSANLELLDGLRMQLEAVSIVIKPIEIMH